MPELNRYLPTAPGAFLEGALDNPGFGDDQALTLLRNRRATAPVLERLGARFGDRRRIVSALVRHPQVPPALAQRLLPALPWRDLAETAAAPYAAAPVRRRAEAILAGCTDELTRGERVALARLAGRGVLPALLDSGEAEVLRAVYDNPRFREADAQRVAERSVCPAALAALAEHARFASSIPVRLILASNPRTPISTALAIVAGLDPEQRHRLAERADVPRIVRVAATRPRPVALAASRGGRP